MSTLPSGNDERVVPVDLTIRWSTGAPEPVLLQSEQKAFVVFFEYAPEPWMGNTAGPVDPGGSERIGVIEFVGCSGAVLGMLNDETIHGHRLWERGLREVGHYGAGQVIHSAWITEYDRGQRVHPGYKASRLSGMKHYILMFHDSTLECLADDFAVSHRRGEMRDVLAELVKKL